MWVPGLGFLAPVWYLRPTVNLDKVWALLISSGNEFHGLVTRCVKENFPLVILTIVTDPPF